MREPLRAIFLILLIAASHLVVATTFLGYCYAYVLSADDTDFAQIVCYVASALAFPVTFSIVLVRGYDNYFGPAILNGLLWAVALYGLYRFVRRRRAEQP